MTGRMWVLLCAAAAALGCVGAASRQLRRLRRAQPSTADLAGQLRGIEPSSLPAFLATLPPGAPETPVLQPLTELDHGPARLAAVNEALLDLDGEIGRDGAVPRAATRIALAAGVALGLVRVAASITTPAGADSAGALGAFGLGLLGAGASALVGRRATAQARAVRAQWDRVGRVVAQRFLRAE